MLSQRCSGLALDVYDHPTDPACRMQRTQHQAQPPRQPRCRSQHESLQLDVKAEFKKEDVNGGVVTPLKGQNKLTGLPGP